MPEPEYTQGPWGPMGNPYQTPEELWTPNKGTLEVSPGLTIGSVHHTEPICRVFGYLLPVVPNAHLIAAAPDMEKVLDAINDGVEGDNISMPEWLWNDVHAALAKARGETP